ncbi:MULTISPECIES: LamG domain-containing protein [unclassified Streptomyces]|uniref:LamG domain-containing protein n=1 Tax=unclassified Streptomyces TaxID=2593676 RepID=UPI00210C33BB|nr:LamG domain-containing protein [Streptomyces sp. DvalAA-14]
MVTAVSAVMLGALPAVAGGGPVALADSAGAAAKTLTQEQSAAARAAATGERVEVVGERTEYSTTYAEPDGMSFTLDQSAVPVRVQRADGSWAAPDPTLEVRSDGSVGPKAAVAGLAFSGGGAGSGLVSISRGGKSLSLGWPGSLPKPVLDGASATYPNIFDGVDLRLTASTEGFSELLVVKTPQAAADPGLRRIEFALSADGLTVAPSGGGGMTAVDADGRAVFSAPAAVMWDSQGDDPVGQRGSSTASKSAGATAGNRSLSPASPGTDPAVDAAGGLPAPSAGGADDPAAGPGDGDVSKVLPVQVDEDSLAVVPDAGLLANPDSSAFPIYIDPSVGLSQTARTQMRSDGVTDFEFDNGSNNEGKGVGHCSNYDGVYCGTDYTERIYYQFSPSNLAGKKVLDATFRDTESWSFTCNAAWLDLERTSNITSSTTWAGRPNNLGTVASRDVSAGRGSACSPSQPAAPIEFHDSRLTQQVADFAAGSFDRLTLLIKARDESATSDWKRFRNDASLSVTYVGLPAAPTGIGVPAGSGVSCETNAADPQVIGDTTPSLTAKTAMAPGGGSEVNLRIRFDVQHKNPDSTWSEIASAVRPMSGYITKVGATETDPYPGTLTDGGNYRLAAFTRSYYNDGASFVESHSNVATVGWCYFRVDSTAPKAPKVTVAAPYSECLANACAAAGGPGTGAAFSFAPASGDTTNIAYEYKLSSSPAWSKPVNGATVHVTVTPRLAGTQQLMVRAEDGAGWGASQPFLFSVKEGQGPVGLWHFDDGVAGSATTTATDTATEGARHNATLFTAGAGWSTFARRGSADQSLWLNDTTNTANQAGYAATTQSAVNTQSSFTVSTWAYLTENSVYRTAVSQTSSDGSGFSLYYSPGIQRWVFLWSWKENGTLHQLGANGSAPVPLKAWTHLTGVYDRDDQTITLYVNGKAQGGPVALSTTALAGASDGALQFGRRQTTTPGTYTDYWQGRVDETAIWQRPLTDDEIATDDAMNDAADTPAVEMVADWNPDGASGTTLADTTSGYARSLSLTGGASLDGQALVLNGTSGAASTPGPVVDGTASFTATTLADLDSAALAKKPAGYTAQLIGQRSSGGSSWGVWYQLTSVETEPDPDGGPDLTVPHGYWWFGRLNADDSFTGVKSDELADLGSPVRLTGTYDAPSDTVHLYVGGTENAVDTTHLPYSADPGTGSFTVSEAQRAGEADWGHYVPGKITDIRLWAGAMNAQQVGSLDD